MNMSAALNSTTVRCMEVFGGNRTAEEHFDLPGIDAYLSSRAYEGRRGGDIHCVSTCGKGDVVRFLVADVAGHGAQVADIAQGFRRLIKKNMNRLDQSRLARTLNEEFMRDNEGGRFVTSLFTSYHRPSGHLLICNAGHPRPLLYRADSKHWDYLDYRIESSVDELLNLPLGIIEPTDYYQFAVRLNPGDAVLLYTDGISDTKKNVGAAAEAEFLETVAAVEFNSVADFAANLRQALGLAEDGHEAIDDETVLVISPNEKPFARLTMRERIEVFGKMLGFVSI